jgi:hypothetical protein
MYEGKTHQFPQIPDKLMLRLPVSPTEGQKLIISSVEATRSRQEMRLANRELSRLSDRKIRVCTSRSILNLQASFAGFQQSERYC